VLYFNIDSSTAELSPRIEHADLESDILIVCHEDCSFPVRRRKSFRYGVQFALFLLLTFGNSLQIISLRLNAICINQSGSPLLMVDMMSV
jgi:hypothetical protein